MWKTCVSLILLTVVQLAQAQSIIPLPQSLSKQTGTFLFDKTTTIVVGTEFRNEVNDFISTVAKRSGFRLSIEKGPKSHHVIELVRDTSGLAEGYYSLNVTPSKISVRAHDPAGAYYAMMTLLQLIQFQENATNVPLSYPIQAVSITDYPRFKWRGLMLDCSRTFIPPDYIKRTLDRMAFYKLNVLHLHLIDDQGWRLEMKSRPLLTQKSSTFPEKYHEPSEFQGFYTQKDIAGLLAYAASKHIEIIPEIEGPGHNQAALYAYPNLSCTNNIKPLFPLFHGDIITAEVFCVGNPDVYPFFDDVITETASLFPTKYLHLGGDEVPRTHWAKCPKCQQLVKTGVVKDTEALQGYFMKKIAESVRKAGKRPLAWDEILEDKNGYISSDWVVMSWRDFTGKNPAIEAIRRGHDIVLSPTSHLYFDYPYETTDTKRVFNYSPFADIPDKADQQHVLGIQANFWSHIDRTQSRIDYQLYPRTLALAERAWSSAENTDFENFKARKAQHLPWLDYMQVIYNKISDR
ncbi:hexosaminidase [Dyadobacter soli]|uniref:beta-N-acetylhexosaminidase n=1 Tax=Dyadobacter soli TaxID=659014 RepID=A0A1G7VIQ2_9BACT|nr:beta-N-acetylhexosaminidase [Dyadobacter soli]SDG59613.1 hexosaminidase [Dyadobacter soli]